jgi:hypothetical protein
MQKECQFKLGTGLAINSNACFLGQFSIYEGAGQIFSIKA